MRPRPQQIAIIKRSVAELSGAEAQAGLAGVAAAWSVLESQNGRMDRAGRDTRLASAGGLG